MSIGFGKILTYRPLDTPEATFYHRLAPGIDGASALKEASARALSETERQEFLFEGRLCQYMILI